MTETTTDAKAPVAPAAGSTPKKGKAAAKKKTSTGKARSKRVSHPPTSQMVTQAIKDLKERGGSSLQAIKKYISTTYKVDAEKMSLFIRKYIKSAVESGSLVQTKGKGAAGSFRLGGSEAGTMKKGPAKPKTKKKAGKAEKKPAAVKVKTAAPKKKITAPKAKKAAKPPTAAKPPKPKKATAKPAKAKKTVARKAPARKGAAKKASPKKK